VLTVSSLPFCRFDASVQIIQECSIAVDPAGGSSASDIILVSKKIIVLPGARSSMIIEVTGASTHIKTINSFESLVVQGH